MAIVKLTRKKIESLPLPDLETNPRGIRYYDESLKGFGIIVYPSGRKSFFVEYGKTTRRRRMTLGQYGKLTSETARQLAKQKLADILSGTDPLDERKTKRSEQTLKEWATEYLKNVSQRKKRPEEDKRYLGWAIERWGKKALSEITAGDISKFYHEIVESGHKTAANRFHASISACLQAAWRLGSIESNPTLKVEKLPENPPRDRVMTDNELTKMLIAISELEDQHLRAAFMLLVQTGARRSEVLRARWEDFDFDTKVWRLPSTKAGRMQIIPITPSICEMLHALPRIGPYVLPGRNPEKHRHDLKRPWKRLQQETGLLDLHIHDLRRSFGLAIAREKGLHVASRLLRHTDISITAKVYAPFNVEDLRGAVEEHDAKILPFRKAGNS